jgi:hypothetical protein
VHRPPSSGGILTRGRRRAAAAAAVVVVLLLILGVTDGTHPTPRTSSGIRNKPAVLLTALRNGAFPEANADNLPKDCLPNPIGPPGAPYQFGIVVVVTDGSLTAGPVAVPNISATICGIVTVTTGTAGCPAGTTIVIPPDGQLFGPLNAYLHVIPGLDPSVPFTPHPQEIVSSLGCQSSQGGLKVSATGNVGGTAGAFGVACSIQVTVPLAGIITGPLDPPFQAHGTFTGQLKVPAVALSPTCPAEVATNLNEIVGLPTVGTVTLPFTAAIYIPGAST